MVPHRRLAATKLPCKGQPDDTDLDAI
jgi:hypothetical protein